MLPCLVWVLVFCFFFPWMESLLVTTLQFHYCLKPRNCRLLLEEAILPTPSSTLASCSQCQFHCFVAAGVTVLFSLSCKLVIYFPCSGFICIMKLIGLWLCCMKNSANLRKAVEVCSLRKCRIHHSIWYQRTGGV